MDIKGEIYFSPRFKFIDIDWDDNDKLIDAFRDRVEGFYLSPAKILNEKKYGFAAGLLCVAAIDLLATIFLGRNNFYKWTKRNIKCLSDYNISIRFYKNFRNGLVHEGRIKNGDQFSYRVEDIIFYEDILLVNPKNLLEQIESAFYKYIKYLKTDDEMFASFKETLKQEFKREIELAYHR